MLFLDLVPNPRSPVCVGWQRKNVVIHLTSHPTVVHESEKDTWVWPSTEPQYFQCSLSLFWENQWSFSSDSLTGFLGLELWRYVYKTPHPPSWKRKDPADKDDRYARSVLLNIYRWVISYLIGGRADGQSDLGRETCVLINASPATLGLFLFLVKYEYRKILSPKNIAGIIRCVYSANINSLSFIVYSVWLF